MDIKRWTSETNELAKSNRCSKHRDETSCRTCASSAASRSHLNEAGTTVLLSSQHVKGPKRVSEEIYLCIRKIRDDRRQFGSG